jgi:Cu/Ag efflux protein CusF
MRTAKLLLAGATAVPALMSTAFAQQTLTGTITTLDRLNGTITIQQTQGGTVGASTGGATDEYKVQDRPALENWHAGDKVSFTVTEGGGTKTITKLEKPKP